jgi:hypothetical protein
MEHRDVRMVLKPAGLIQRECPSVELFRFDRVALAAADDAEGSECGGEFEVVLSEASLFDRERPAQPLFGRRVVAALGVKGAEVPERDRDLVVVVPEGAFEDGEGGFQEGARFVVPAGGGENRGQCCAVGGGIGMVGTDGGITDFDRAGGRGLPVGGPSGGVGETAEVMQHGGDLGIVGSEARSQYLAGGCVQLRGFVEAAGVLQQHGQVVAEPSRCQIVIGQVSLGDSQCPPVEPFSEGGVASSTTSCGQSLQPHHAMNMSPHLIHLDSLRDGDRWALPSAEHGPTVALTAQSSSSRSSLWLVPERASADPAGASDAAITATPMSRR